MTSLTLDLPPRLAQALAARQIDEKQAPHIALAALELSVEEGIGPIPLSPAGEIDRYRCGPLLVWGNLKHADAPDLCDLTNRDEFFP